MPEAFIKPDIASQTLTALNLIYSNLDLSTQILKKYIYSKNWLKFFHMYSETCPGSIADSNIGEKSDVISWGEKEH